MSQRNDPLKTMDIMRLKVEIEEIVKGTIGLEFIKGYDAQELLFLCKETARQACEAHEIIEGIAAEFGVDLSKHIHLKNNHRIFISDSTLSHMRMPGLKLQLEELIECLQRLSDHKKIREKWAQRKEKEQG